MEPLPHDARLTAGPDTLEVPPDALRAIAEALRDVPHRRVLVLGARSGPLASRLPGSLVVNAGRGDGRRALEAGGPFDAVVSLRGIPTDRLPEIRSESPETYRRGEKLEQALVMPTAATREASAALASAKGLGRVGGHVVLLETLPGLSQSLLFARLLCGAGLRVTEWRRLNSARPRAALGCGRGHTLIVAEVRPGPVPFREEAALASLLPNPGKTTLHRLPQPGSGGRLTRAGPEAEAHFRWLSQGAREVSVGGRRPGGLEFKACFGVAEPAAAYLYYCDTGDVRELDVVDVRLGWELCGPFADRLAAAVAGGTAYDVRPSDEALAAQLRAMLGKRPPSIDGVSDRGGGFGEPGE